MKGNYANRSPLFMRALVLVLFMTCTFQWGFAQINLKLSNPTLGKVIEQIQSQTKYKFFYDDKLAATKVDNVNFKDASVTKVLDTVLKGKGISYKLEDKVIYLSVSKEQQKIQAGKMRKLTGKVVDESGEPLIGVNVLVKGTTTGTVTNLDGEFVLNTDVKHPVLSLTYIGYKPLEVNAKDDVTFNLVMQSDTQLIGEVVVTALGIKRSEKALSYNVQKVENDALTTVKDANFVNSLNGKVAGVNIQRSSSGVGGATKVVMRGAKSIGGDNNVLYVIDGVPVGNQADRSGDGVGFGSGRASSEGIADFNPEDIESVSVLTGPSAAALYGASAANGVILINTKKGAAGKVKVNVSSSVEFMNPLILPEFQNEYGHLENSYMSWGKKLENPSSYRPKDFFNTGNTFNNSFNLSTGTEKNQTYLSASAVNSSGIVPNNKYHRYNVTFRNTAKFLNDKLVLDASASYVREFANNMVSYGTYFNPIVGVYLYPVGKDFSQEKYFERYNGNVGYNTQYWSPGDFGMDIQNPYWIAYRNIRPEVKDRYMLFGSLTYNITDFLNVAGRLRMDNTYSEAEDKRYASTFGTFAKPKGAYAYSNSSFKQKYADFMVNFNKYLNDDFHLQVNAGTSFEEYDTKGHGYKGNLLLVPNKFVYSNIDPATASPTQSGGDSRRQNFAVFASGELSWKSKLFLTMTGRGDKPSQLVNSDTPWIWYPSVGLSAIVTELLSDDWKAKITPVLSFMKVRGSYTEVGSPIPYTGLTPGTQTRKIVGGEVQQYEYYPLSNLKGERTRSYELGLDTKWFNNKISLGVTLYQSNTFNQLLKADLGKGSGYNYMFVQAGNVRNRGIELTLGYDQKFGEFGYNTTVTATANRNKIIELASNVKNPVTGAPIDLSTINIGRFKLVEGGEIGDVYESRQIKRDADGYIDYQEGTGLIVETTAPYKLGSVNAKWNMGWNNSFSYKGFRLNMLLNARLGGIVISGTQAALDRYGVSKASAEARNAGGVVMGENLIVDPQHYYQTVAELNSYNVYSATNVRLQEASLSYTFPKKWFNNVVDNLTLAVYGSNLWMIYNKAPFDPELAASTGTFGQGYDYFMLPSQRTVGVSLKFGF